VAPGRKAVAPRKSRERLQCGGFSTALRLPENHPVPEKFLPPDSAAEDGALQTLRAIRNSPANACHFGRSIESGLMFLSSSVILVKILVSLYLPHC
jgi:hypothetical protein